MITMIKTEFKKNIKNVIQLSWIGILVFVSITNRGIHIGMKPWNKI